MLLYVIAIVAISAVTIIECLINRRDYAIFIINGISRKAVYSMILIKNLILIIVSALAAWLYCQWETFGKIIVQTAGEYGNELNYTAKIMAHCIYVPIIIESRGCDYDSHIVHSTCCVSAWKRSYRPYEEMRWREV